MPEYVPVVTYSGGREETLMQFKESTKEDVGTWVRSIMNGCRRGDQRWKDVAMVAVVALKTTRTPEESDSYFEQWYQAVIKFGRLRTWKLIRQIVAAESWSGITLTVALKDHPAFSIMGWKARQGIEENDFQQSRYFSRMLANALLDLERRDGLDAPWALSPKAEDVKWENMRQRLVKVFWDYDDDKIKVPGPYQVEVQDPDGRGHQDPEEFTRFVDAEKRRSLVETQELHKNKLGSGDVRCYIICAETRSMVLA